MSYVPLHRKLKFVADGRYRFTGESVSHLADHWSLSDGCLGCGMRLSSREIYFVPDGEPNDNGFFLLSTELARVENSDASYPDAKPNDTYELAAISRN